jgi:hypothetical protein
MINEGSNFLLLRVKIGRFRERELPSSIPIIASLRSSSLPLRGCGAWNLHTIRHMTESPSNNIPSFTLSPGVLRPLFLVGIKCRDVYLRREAIEMLAAKPRREGLYDSALCVKCAQWVEALEDRYRVAGIVPSWARVGAIAVNFGMEDRRGTMSFTNGNDLVKMRGSK